MRAAWILIAVWRVAAAQQDDDAAALALADRTQAVADTPRTCVEYAEAAATDTTDSTPAPSTGRASLNIRCDGALGRQWRAVFSDRLDYFWAHGSSAEAVNTLKEAYVSYRDGGTELFDVGRINVREGVGFAYNPSDYFRANAVRAIISIDPGTLRDERLGTLMARSQTLWSSGSLTALYAPRVNADPNASTFSPDLGATNDRSRWVLLLSQRLGADFQPQLSVTGAEHQSPQAGLNLTYLLNSATVAYVEWSGGRGPSNLAAGGYLSAAPAVATGLVAGVGEVSTSVPAASAVSPAVATGPNAAVAEAATSVPPAPAASPAVATAFHSRLSTGFTYTTPYKLSVTLEYEYDGAAPSRSEWAAIRNGPVAPYVQYREYAGAQAELAARQNIFGYAHWDDVGIPHLDLTAFVRFDPYDHSRVTWTEARYHWRHAGVALQWQRRTGDATSDFAPWPVRQSWLALIDYYF